MIYLAALSLRKVKAGACLIYITLLIDKARHPREICRSTSQAKGLFQVLLRLSSQELAAGLRPAAVLAESRCRWR